QMNETVEAHHFGMLSYGSNIALMHLDVSLEYSAAVRPVCLPNSIETLSSSALHVVPGWGLSKKVGLLILHMGTKQTGVPVLENEICEINYYFNYPGGITTRMLCAGFVSVGGQNS
ncbi:OVCH1 protein, partial [Sakesphorus luctuosus]|nr:OVCH1 protein [Sakesphorus luctuosus]